jgi:hypothetical protein
VRFWCFLGTGSSTAANDAAKRIAALQQKRLEAIEDEPLQFARVRGSARRKRAAQFQLLFTSVEASSFQVCPGSGNTAKLQFQGIQVITSKFKTEAGTCHSPEHITIE